MRPARMQAQQTGHMEMKETVEIPGIPDEIVAEIRATQFRDCDNCGGPVPAQASYCGWCKAPREAEPAAVKRS